MSFVKYNLYTFKCYKPNIQHTAVQRAFLQPVARSLPTGLTQVWYGRYRRSHTRTTWWRNCWRDGIVYTTQKEPQERRTIDKGELAKQDKIDDMAALRDAPGSSSGSASGFGHISDTAMVPTRPRTQSYEDQTSRNLRGSIEQPRWEDI